MVGFITSGADRGGDEGKEKGSKEGCRKGWVRVGRKSISKRQIKQCGGVSLTSATIGRRFVESVALGFVARGC